jgi:hypothetical protein
LRHVRQGEGDSSLTLEDVARKAKISPVFAQTALCEYNKYILMWTGAKPICFYNPQMSK